MSKEFEKVINILEETKAKREAELEEAYQKFHDAQNIVREAKQKLLTAEVNGDEKTYREYSKKKDEAASMIEMYQARIAHLEDEAIITDEECNKFLNKVYAIQDKKRDEAEKRISNLLQELNKEAGELLEFIQEGNEILFRWSRDIKPIKKEIGKKEGRPLYAPVNVAYDGATNLTNYLLGITRHYQYKQITGKASNNLPKKPRLNIN